jgi:hypothetical protein
MLKHKRVHKPADGFVVVLFCRGNSLQNIHNIPGQVSTHGDHGKSVPKIDPEFPAGEAKDMIRVLRIKVPSNILIFFI